MINWKEAARHFKEGRDSWRLAVQSANAHNDRAYQALFAEQVKRDQAERERDEAHAALEALGARVERLGARVERLEAVRTAAQAVRETSFWRDTVNRRVAVWEAFCNALEAANV